MKKPIVKLIGEDGNIFSIMSKCTKALKLNKQEKEAKELSEKIFNSSSYHEALQICMEYVEVEQFTLFLFNIYVTLFYIYRIINKY